MKVSDILRVKGNTLYTVPPDQPLAEAVQTMAERDIGSLVVMEYGDLVGMLTFREVIAKSSNVGTIKTALRVANRPFYDTIRAFGFGRLTQIDLPGESAGLLMPVERWGPIAKAYIAFGQGISVTPLRLDLTDEPFMTKLAELFPKG